MSLPIARRIFVRAELEKKALYANARYKVNRIKRKHGQLPIQINYWDRVENLNKCIIVTNEILDIRMSKDKLIQIIVN